MSDIEINTLINNLNDRVLDVEKHLSFDYVALKKLHNK